MTPFFAFLNTLNTFGASVQTKITSKSSLLSIDQSECIICDLDTEIFPSQLPAGYIDLYLQDIQVSQEEWTKLRECVPYVELYRYNPKHLYPKLNGYGDNGQRSLKL